MLLASAIPASASTWTVRQLGGEAAQATMFGVSCPGASLCVAVGSDNTVASSTNPTGPASAWAVTDLDGEGPNTHLYGVSCPTAGFCVASAGGGKILTATDPTGAAAWSVTQLAEPLELRGVSCPSTRSASSSAPVAAAGRRTPTSVRSSAARRRSPGPGSRFIPPARKAATSASPA